MALRFRKSIKVAPGLRVNLGKKSVGMSIGNKYGGVSVNSSGRVTKRASIPGTGISSVKTTSTKNRKANDQQSATPQLEQPNAKTMKISAVILIAMAVLFLILTIGAIGSGNVGGAIFTLVVTILLGLVGLGRWGNSKKME